MKITPELVELLNPEGKRLTQAQWKAKIEKHEAMLQKKANTRLAAGEQPGVCNCGHKSFHLKVLPGQGMLERKCKQCGTIKIV